MQESDVKTIHKRQLFVAPNWLSCIHLNMNAKVTAFHVVTRFIIIESDCGLETASFAEILQTLQ